MGHPYQGRRILVTGGTGSIGSEIVRKLLLQKPAVVRIFSRDETKQFEMEQYFRNRPDPYGDGSNLRFLVGDVRDAARLRRALTGIEVVFHAAALKHVGSCEYNPFEAVQTNVLGTQNLIEAAIDARVERVVAVSTDKAVNPTGTMGATKLVAERIVAGAGSWAHPTRLLSVRFGNVLGSRGSIVPALREQVRVAGRVTLTDRRMRRFVMSLGEAAGLVLEAGSDPHVAGGETFVLKMPCVALTDLIDALVAVFAAEFGKDPKRIRREVIGTRAGERIHEALLVDEEAERTRLQGPFMVVLPFHLLKSSGSSRKPVPPVLYRTDKAPLLKPPAIRALLARSGIGPAQSGG